MGRFGRAHIQYTTSVVNVHYISAQTSQKGIKCTKDKGNSVQEACTKCFGVHILKFEILQTTWKKQNKKHQNARFIDEKLKTKSLMFFVLFFSCDLQDFKFQYVNPKAFGASFLYWVDFKGEDKGLLS